MTVDVASVTERVNLRFGELTAAERRAARALLSDYPVAGLTSIHRFAERAGVSAATVVRFVQTLGFTGYGAFQDSLRTEVQARQDSSLTQALRRVPPTADSTLGSLQTAGKTYADGIEHTFATLRESEVDQLVSWLADSQRRIVAVGGAFSTVLATHLVRELAQFRAGAVVLPEEQMGRVEHMLSADGTVWVVFDFRRYSAAVERIAKEAKARGARIALVTDRWLSPLASIADVVLCARVESAGPSDTLVPAMALVEAICTATVAKLDDDGLARLRQVEEVRRALETTIASKKI